MKTRSKLLIIKKYQKALSLPFVLLYLIQSIQSHSVVITTTDLLKQQKNENHLIHIVKQGETLSEISEKYYYGTYASVEVLKMVNKIDNENELYINQKLIIPTSNYFLEQNDLKDVLNNTRFIAKRDIKTKDMFLGIYFCAKEHPEYEGSCLDSTKFVVIQFALYGKQKNIFDFSYLNEKYWPYANWKFVDLDGDGGVDALGEWMQGSDNYTMHIAMYFDGKNYLECEVAGEIALGRFNLKREKTGTSIFEYQHRGDINNDYISPEKTVVKWSEIKGNCKKSNFN